MDVFGTVIQFLVRMETKIGHFETISNRINFIQFEQIDHFQNGFFSKPIRPIFG